MVLLRRWGPRPESLGALGKQGGCKGPGSSDRALLTPQFPMGPGSDGPMGGMGGMEPHHMNGSLGKPAPARVLLCLRVGLD